MKETYYVGYDPAKKTWDTMKIIPTFHAKCWVFKVIARNDHEALWKGLDAYKAMTDPLDKAERMLVSHILNQVSKNSRMGDEQLLVEIPSKLMEQAKSLASKNFCKVAYEDELLIDLASAGYKAMKFHDNAAPPQLIRPVVQVESLAL